MTCMTWKTYARVQACSSMLCAAVALASLMITLTGHDRNGLVPGIFLGAGLAIVGRWQAIKAGRHTRIGDPDPVSWAELIQRL
jgi:hypothetical protein